jgi:RNA polymerase sigma factor (sigma-70 family)
VHVLFVLNLKYMSDSIDNERLRRLLVSYPVKAIQILYQHYHGSLLRIAAGLTRNVRTAEDIVQEAFAHVWENHKLLGRHHDKPIFYYLARVVKNMAISEYKGSIVLAVRKNKLRQYLVAHASEAPVDNQLVQKEVRSQVRRLISTFPLRERQCLLIRLDEQCSVDEIAKRLGITKKAVERSITSANKRLRRLWPLEADR